MIVKLLDGNKAVVDSNLIAAIIEGIDKYEILLVKGFVLSAKLDCTATREMYAAWTRRAVEEVPATEAPPYWHIQTCDLADKAGWKTDYKAGLSRVKTADEEVVWAVEDEEDFKKFQAFARGAIFAKKGQ